MSRGRPYRPDPTAWLPRVLTRSQAAARGLSDHAVDRLLRSGRWVRLTPGVYCTAPPVQSPDLLHAAAAHGGPSACLSGAAALTAYGFRSVTSFDRVLLLLPLTHGAGSFGAIHSRPTPHLPRARVVDGLPLAPVARAVVDHGLTLRRLDDARAVVAEAVQRGRCTPTDLLGALTHAPRRDSKAVRQAVLEIAAGARSAPEARAAAAFRAVDLPCWRANVPVEAVGRTYVVDVLFDELRAVVEIDGEEYHRFGADWARTLDRDAALQTAGYAVLHVRPSQVADAGTLLDVVTAWLRRRAHDLGVAWRWG